VGCICWVNFSYFRGTFGSGSDPYGPLKLTTQIMTHLGWNVSGYLRNNESNECGFDRISQIFRIVSLGHLTTSLSMYLFFINYSCKKLVLPQVGQVPLCDSFLVKGFFNWLGLKK